MNEQEAWEAYVMANLPPKQERNGCKCGCDERVRQKKESNQLRFVAYCASSLQNRDGITIRQRFNPNGDLKNRVIPLGAPKPVAVAELINERWDEYGDFFVCKKCGHGTTDEELAKIHATWHKREKE